MSVSRNLFTAVVSPSADRVKMGYNIRRQGGRILLEFRSGSRLLIQTRAATDAEKIQRYLSFHCNSGHPAIAAFHKHPSLVP